MQERKQFVVTCKDCHRAVPTGAKEFPFHSMEVCCLEQERQAKGHPTLGFIRPHRIEKLIIAPDTPTWTAAQQAVLRQGHLFGAKLKNELEKILHEFKYKFFCDHASCKGHALSCTDWEIGESCRQWKKKYGDKWEEKFRERYEKQMINELDTHFLLGTLHQHPNRWIIVGLFYPQHSTKGAELF